VVSGHGARERDRERAREIHTEIVETTHAPSDRGSTRCDASD